MRSYTDCHRRNATQWTKWNRAFRSSAIWLRSWKRWWGVFSSVGDEFGQINWIFRKTSAGIHARNLHAKWIKSWLQFVPNIFCTWFSQIFEMKEFFKWFDIHITCLIFSAGPYEKIIKKISTLVAEKLAKNKFSRSAIFARICRDVTQIMMSQRVRCTGLLC